MPRPLTIAQILLDGASEYERKSQRIDAVGLAASHTITSDPAGADLAHVYGPSPIPAGAARRIGIPYVASSAPARSRLSFRKTPQPRQIITPLRGTALEFVPEAIDESWFEVNRGVSLGDSGAPRTIGSFGRPSVADFLQQTLSRIHRFRDDVSWIVFEAPPASSDLQPVDLWVDPATDENDFDGFVAEALAAGVPVVAARTAINEQRLEKGRCGIVVRPRDPNEMTHAILAALFKPEVVRVKLDAARQTVSKFRSRQRLRVLERLYEKLTG